MRATQSRLQVPPPITNRHCCTYREVVDIHAVEELDAGGVSRMLAHHPYLHHGVEVANLADAPAQHVPYTGQVQGVEGIGVPHDVPLLVHLHDLVRGLVVDAEAELG